MQAEAAADHPQQDQIDVHPSPQTMASPSECAVAAQLLISLEAEGDAAGSSAEMTHAVALSQETKQRWRRLRSVSSMIKAVQDSSDASSYEGLAAIPEPDEDEVPEHKRLSKDDIYWNRMWQLFKAQNYNDTETFQSSSDLQRDLPRAPSPVGWSQM